MGDRLAPESVIGFRRNTQIYNWFTEEFDTKDLQDAKALLEELA